MKNTLKFLSIGFALVLLVISQQMSGQPSAEAAVATLNEDTVKWISDGDGSAGTANAVTAGTAVKYYTAGNGSSDVAHFYIRDSTLNVEHSGATIIGNEIEYNTAGQFDTNDADAAVAHSTTFGLNGDLSDCVGANTACHETNSKFDAGNTPIVPGSLAFNKASVIDNVTVMDLNSVTLGNSIDHASAAANVQNGEVVIIDPSAGTYQIKGANIAIGGGTDKYIVASYKFNAADGYVQAERRAKVWSTSDTAGEYVAITEVQNVENEKHLTNGNYFMGRVVFSTDASAAATGNRTVAVSNAADSGSANVATPEVWVQDGDTITIEYMGACEKTSGSCTADGTVIATATATIDAGKPTISDVFPADGTLTKDTSPQIGFTIADDGIGFDSNIANYGDHVAVQINGCDVTDAEISVSAHSTSSISYTFDLAGSDLWSTPAKQANGSDDADCNPQRTTKGFNVNTATLTVEDGSGSTTDNDRTIHGVAFQWKITATDDAGNAKVLETTSLDMTIDGTAPSSSTVTAAKAWDAVALDSATPPTAGKDVTDNSSLKLTFTETMDRNSVTASDFRVSGTGVVDSTISSVTFGGKQGATDTFVYLDLAADLAPNARPKVELIGSVSDISGNVWTAVGTSTGAITIATAADGVQPTISGISIDDNKLDNLEKATLTFTSDEALTNSGSGATAEACTCVYVTGGSSDILYNNTTTGATIVNVTLTDTTAGKAELTQGTAPLNVTHGIFAATVVGRDANTKYGRGGAIKVLGEDVSASYTATVNANTAHWVQIDNWPIINIGTDGNDSRDMRTAIFGATVNGTTRAATLSRIDWREAGDNNGEKIAVALPVQVTATDVVKFDYYYADPSAVIEVDKLAPTATASPLNDATTENVRQRITVAYASEDEYAGDTHRTVTMTKATLKDPAGVIVDILPNMSSSDNINFYYKPGADLDLGQYTLTVDAEDDSGNSGADQVFKFTVSEKAKTTIAMEAGWNLISLPANPKDTAINSVITNEEVTTVLTYDPSIPGGWLTAVRDAGVLTGTLSTIDATRAYWIYQEDGDDIKTLIPGASDGVQNVPPAIPVVKGWNLLPIASMNVSSGNVVADTYFANLDWNKAKGWNATTELWIDVVSDTGDGDLTDGANVVIGKGYWVFANKAGTLIP